MQIPPRLSEGAGRNEGVPRAVRPGDGSMCMLSCAGEGGSAVSLCVPTSLGWQLARAGLV